MYIYDAQWGTDTAATAWAEHNQGTHPHIMLELLDMLHAVNPYIPLYQQAHDQLHQLHGGSFVQMQMALPPGFDRRRYNLPQEREIAAILPGSNEHATIGRDLIVKLRLLNDVAADEQPQYECIWETNFNYTPLMYVLLFPHGEPGWGPGILLSNPGPQPGHGDAPIGRGGPRGRQGRGGGRGRGRGRRPGRGRGLEQGENSDEGEDEGEGMLFSQYCTYCMINSFFVAADADYVTMTRFWAFRLFERIIRGVQPPTREPTTVLRGGRLLQQLIVDCWASAEQLKLRWICTNQGTIRADLYQGLVDALRTDDLDANSIGRRIVLPSSFTGSDRSMSQLYQDSMALACKFGPATYFITVTANPNWEEIQTALLPLQQASDRPDLVSHVFHRKLTLLLKHLKKVFGTQLARVHVIEFQKCGLPHSHILLWVTPEYHPHSAEALDKVCILPTPNYQSIQLTISPKVISAKIPDPHSRLYGLVTSQMIHHCSSKRCLDQNKKCRKAFPKAFCEETSMDDNWYPTYA